MASRQLRSNSKKSKMDFHISSRICPEEASYRLNHYPDVSSISTSRLSCTKCDTVIKPRMVTANNVHPVLEVLLCRKCRHFYDQRNSQNVNLCAWCANERTLFGCSTCSAKFCEGCINKNFRLARIIFQEINECKWKCCICFSKPIWSQRAVCAAARIFADNSNNSLKERIAKCHAVNKPSQVPASVHNQSTAASDIVITDSVTFSASHQRRTVPVSTSASKPVEKLELVAMEDSTLAVSQRENSLVEQCENKSKTCVICLLNPPIMVLYPCGHKCLCKQCSALLSLREKVCPLCRKEFRDIIRLYE